MPASLLFLRFSALLALVGAAAGCSDPPDLTIKGRSYTFTSECWKPYTGASSQLAVARFSGGESGGVCDLSPKDGGVLTVSAFALDAGGAPILGTYPLDPAGGGGGVTLFAYDSMCGLSPTECATADSGQVVLTDYVGGHLIGTYGVRFPTGEHTAGRFDAPSCSTCESFGSAPCN